MSDSAQNAGHGEEIHPVLGRMGTSGDPAAKEALRERAEHFTHTEPAWKARRRDTADVDLDPQDDAVEWAHTFVRGGTDKTVTAVDTDPQGSATVWQLGADGEASRA
ncbi:hypothetical protein A6P39_000105 [Streptomyces sp. FXJ1.172]|uniref:hypothetical protein n=1 Tax=Streptomyces sp. FXJ1.172 TaxID=710705 RepID=UPI0007CF7DE7|nr:hypothetical protein [Streptomyces sp. FXJ1.172]WEO92661.1 hypothetical protein A6P39_000105 [Streptomyces sp. FXJ1.172]